jgi:PAS domain S-box-containing protein
MKAKAARTPRRDDDEVPPRYWSSLSESEVVRTLDRITDGIAVIGPDWRFRYLNQSAATMLERPRTELIGSTLWSYFRDTGSERFQAALEECVLDRRPFAITEYYSPVQRWFESRGFPQDENVVVLFRDISDQRLAVDRLQEYSDRMSEAERIAHFGVWRWDLVTDRIHMSDELQAIYGLEPLPARPSGELIAQVHSEDLDRVAASLQRARQTHQPFAFEHRIVRADGEERSLYCHGCVVGGPDGDATALIGVCHDETERSRTERALGLSRRRMRAIIDHLPSMVSVKDLGGRYMLANAECGRVLDLPLEKIVGQLCHHLFPEVADEQRARDARALARDEPIYDESVLVVDGRPRAFDTVTFTLPDESGRAIETCTIGTDVTERRELDSERRERMYWVARIESALREDRMLVYAQPIVAVPDGHQVGAELLVRMRAPEDPAVILEPASILPAAERYGLVQTIDAWMVRQALSLAPSFAPSVNLSAVTLSDPAARREILDILRSDREAARSLMFEITETATAESLDAASEFAGELTRLGCGLALDDFGTGYGSFTYLRRLPLRHLKIDRSFVLHLTTSEDDRRVVQSIVSIAGQFGLRAIAEGVEDEATLALLAELGTHFAQGYHLGRPAPVISAAEPTPDDFPPVNHPRESPRGRFPSPPG